MKIAYIIQSLHIGGTETCIYNIAKKLPFDYHFIATSNPDIHPRFKSIGKTTYLGENWDRITLYLSDNQIDILQYGNLPEYKNCALKAKTPVIIERVAGPRSIKSDHAGITHLISSSNGIIPQIQKVYSGPITMIHNGVDLKTAVKPKRLFNSDDFVVIYPCSRLGSGQRVGDLIKAVINTKQLNIKLIITGDRPNQKGYENIKPELMKMAKPLGNRCIFTGFVDNVAELINGSDLCIVPATTHGISNGLLEGSAYHKPIISTDVGQASEICHHGKSGYLVRLGDIEQMSRYIKYLSNTPEMCVSMGNYGYELIKKEFNLDIQAAKYKELYERLSSSN